jgi:pectate lyase
MACQEGQSCQNGACGCNGEQELCAGQCRDTSQDPAHCGACNAACPSGQGCNGGSCECDAGFTLCDAACVDTSSDANHCGTCNNACQGATCSGGSCTQIETGVIGWASVSGDGVSTTTGGDGGNTVSVSSASELQAQASGSSARIIQVSGTIGVNELDVGSNKTIVGVGGATLNGGINIGDESNVIIRNLNINGRNSTADGDGIHVQRSHHVWIDHVNIWDASDGNLDINDSSNWITVSWSIFSYSSNPPDDNHRYSNLIGSGDGVTTDRGRLKITWHHNWWSDRVHERMPRVRFGQVHVFNNFYSSSGNNYCIRAGVEANILVENNYFENVDTPHEIDASGAIINANGNTYSGTTGATDESGSAFTPPYPYTLEAPEAARSAIQSNAGPQ